MFHLTSLPFLATSWSPLTPPPHPLPFKPPPAPPPQAWDKFMTVFINHVKEGLEMEVDPTQIKGKSKNKNKSKSKTGEYFLMPFAIGRTAVLADQLTIMRH